DAEATTGDGVPDMRSASQSRILLCADEPAAVDDLRRLLERAGHAVVWQGRGACDPDGLAACSLIVLDASRHVGEALDFCRRLRLRLADCFVPILFLTSDHDPAARLAGFAGGADACLLRPFASGELLAQVGAFLRLKEMHDRLAEKTAETHRINQRLQLAHQ